MAVIETWVNCDLKKPVMMNYMDGLMFTGDNLGNLIGVNVFSDGEPVQLSGTVIGYCILANGSSIPISGLRTNNKAKVTIPEAAYNVPGKANIIIKIVEGSTITTLAAVNTTIVGIGNVPADPSQETIEAWTAQINATISALESGAVRYDESQSLTTSEKETARSNIGANTSAVSLESGDYKIVMP